MLHQIKHLSVNWVDGMKITKEHFNNLEDNWTNRIQDLAQLHLKDYNFGLLNVPSGEPLLVEISNERVEISKCHAITRGGVRIEIDGHDIPSLRKPMMELLGSRELSGTKAYYIVIKANAYQKTPYGEPNPEETPLRYPYALPTYELDMLADDMLNTQQFGTTAIPIAKIKSSYNQGIVKEETYIPPCTSIKSSNELHNIYKRYHNNVTLIDGYLFEIIRKAIEKEKRGSSNTLSDDIKFLSLSIVNYINTNIDTYRLTLADEPPIYMVEWFVRFARVIKSNLRFLNDKKQVLDYFNVYIKGKQPVALEEVLDNMCTISYNHFDIRTTLDFIDRFLLFFDDLFKALKELQWEEFAGPGSVINTVKKPTSSKSGGGSIVINSGRKKKGWGLK